MTERNFAQITLSCNVLFDSAEAIANRVQKTEFHSTRISKVLQNRYAWLMHSIFIFMYACMHVNVVAWLYCKRTIRTTIDVGKKTVNFTTDALCDLDFIG